MITRRQLLIYSTVSLLLPAGAVARYVRPIAVLSEPFQTVAVVHGDLFPGGSGIPSPAFLNAVAYLNGVLHDPLIETDEKVFLKNGAVWLNESAQEAYGKAYYRLNGAERRRVLQTVSQTQWGDNWLWKITAYLFEALLCDPVYGANTDEAGWRWLGHEPGYPRPLEAVA